MTTDIAGLADLNLPPQTSEHAPQFTRADACRQWLSGVAITNAPQAQAQLLRQLDLLNRYALPTDERLAIVEFLRSPIYFIHGECAKRFATQPPLPLAQPEQAAFAASHALWLALQTGYLACLQSLVDRHAQTPLSDTERRNAALAATRALTTALCIHLDHCNTGLLPGPDFWHRLHRIYYAAERLDVAQLVVADKLTHATSVTAQATYVEALLVAIAQPHALRPKQLAQTIYWAHRWATKVPLLRIPPEDLRTPPLCIDMSAGHGGEFSSPRAAAALRWLDLADLRKTIKQRLIKLGEGVSPQDLKLGKDCTQPACELLLRQVYGDWCKGSREPGSGGDHDYQLLGSVDAIHYQLSGDVFRPPQQSVYLSKREADEIATFGHVATRQDDRKALDEFIVENWQSLTEGVVDVELQRPLDQRGVPLAVDRLVALRQGGNDHGKFQLGRIGWACTDLALGVLRIGIRLLPGTPTAATVINPGSGASKTQYCRGFCLPAVESLNQPTSVLTPAGWFRSGHIIELKTDDTRRVKLTKLIERGADFERCGYEAV